MTAAEAIQAALRDQKVLDLLRMWTEQLKGRRTK